MKKFKFKDGSIITAATVEEAKSKHKVMSKSKNKADENYYSKFSNEEKSILIKNGFKIGRDYGDSEYAIKSLSKPKNKYICANINKTKKGKFDITCYVNEYGTVEDKVIEDLYDSFLSNVDFSTNTIKEALSKINKYFRLVEEYINLTKTYKKRIEKIEDDALHF